MEGFMFSYVVVLFVYKKNSTHTKKVFNLILYCKCLIPPYIYGINLTSYIVQYNYGSKCVVVSLYSVNIMFFAKYIITTVIPIKMISINEYLQTYTYLVRYVTYGNSVT